MLFLFHTFLKVTVFLGKEFSSIRHIFKSIMLKYKLKRRPERVILGLIMEELRLLGSERVILTLKGRVFFELGPRMVEVSREDYIPVSAILFSVSEDESCFKCLVTNISPWQTGENQYFVF